jgi:acetyl-CoA C-acetyltransferase
MGKTDAIRDKVAIVGMGCCKFGENWDKDPQDMIVEAAYEAYADAGLEDPHAQIEAVFCGAQYPSKGTAEVADALKMYDRPVSMVVNYCATGTDAFRYGVFAVASGMYDTVLVVGFDKPKDRGVSGPSVAVTGVRGLPATPAGWFSLCAAQYFQTYGAGREDLAKIAVKNHHNGTLAPKSMLKREITVDDVLKARIISWPFGLYDCAAQRRSSRAASWRSASATTSCSCAASASRCRRTRRKTRASTSCAGRRPRWRPSRSTPRPESPTPGKRSTSRRCTTASR